MSPCSVRSRELRAAGVASVLNAGQQSHLTLTMHMYFLLLQVNSEGLFFCRARQQLLSKARWKTERRCDPMSTAVRRRSSQEAAAAPRTN